VSQVSIEKRIMNFLKERLKDPHVSEAAKFALIKKVVGGLCCQCKGIPTKIVSYDVGDAQLIEKYCEKCFKKWKKSEKTLTH
jgi:hypothetical protein